MIGRILLAIGYLSTPFAGPGSAVLTSAGWLTYGAEVRKPTYSWIGLVGLLGIAGILAGRYAGLGGGIEGLAGVVLLLYYVLSIVALWIVGVKSNNMPLKAAAVVLAVAWLLAATGVQAAAAQAPAASDWGGISWASQAAHSVIQSIGGTQALSKVLTAAGAVLAAVGFLGAAEAQGEGREETIFSMGVHF